MSFFKDTVTPPNQPAAAPRPVPLREAERPPAPALAEAPRRVPERAETRAESRAESRAEPRPDAKESFIAADLTIDGKIEGVGNVRIAGRFKGDVHVRGNLTLDGGAHLTGQVSARQVVVSGELHGNIHGAQRVELLETGVLVGDLKAGSLTVAAGSRMRGQVEFGWDEKGESRPEAAKGAGPAA
jgi:cytoskeletal protein CcmA (bactofilin family)